ncbi:hypothetical protein BJX99DRAFT_223441 [Aspergillus californicus]
MACLTTISTLLYGVSTTRYLLEEAKVQLLAPNHFITRTEKVQSILPSITARKPIPSIQSATQATRPDARSYHHISSMLSVG